MSNSTKLHIKELSIGYNQHNPLIESINSEFTLGQTIGLVGRNGSGKSTLIKTLIKTIKPLQGEISINGENINSFHIKQYAKLVSVLFSNHIIPGLTNVEDLISLGRSPYTNFMGNLSRTDKEQIEQTMVMLNIQHLKNRMAATLSDGEKQKVMLARALVQDTTILLLDEPTSYLDLPSKYEFFDLLNKIGKISNKIILIASHEWEMLSNVCSDYMIFKQKEVILSHSLKEELESLQRVYKP